MAEEDKLPQTPIYMLIETYPTEDVGSADSCQNGGQLQEINQKYYECWFNVKPDDRLRVTKESYDFMQSSAYYTKRTTCEVKDSAKKVCVCPSGFSGSLCSTQLYHQCFV